VWFVNDLSPGERNGKIAGRRLNIAVKNAAGIGQQALK
jgi:hypothetical protein